MSNFNLSQREGEPPKTGLVVPQLQYSDLSPRDVYEKVAQWFFSNFPQTREEPTRISVPSTRALWLDENIEAPQSSFMPPPGSREFAHLHEDGSFHLVMSEADQKEIVSKGWGLYHPYKDRGVNEVLLYAPRDMEEFELIKPVVDASYRFAIRDHQGHTI
ncbi:MAG: hypothetical protein ACR2O3_13060 [Rhizobiaceae bacterium]